MIQFKYDIIVWLASICVEIYVSLNLCYDVLYCSLHGLIRGENMELGRDSDTGGQVMVSLNVAAIMPFDVSKIFTKTILVSYKDMISLSSTVCCFIGQICCGTC
jgi:hypothetical protein